MSGSGSVGSDEQISGSKIDPLAAPVKEGVSLDKPSGGIGGDEVAVDQSRVDPMGGKGQYQHPEPHADSQGVVGREDVIEGSKIDPMTTKDTSGLRKTVSGEGTGLDDEAVDSARVDPMGEVREEMDVK